VAKITQGQNEATREREASGTSRERALNRNVLRFSELFLGTALLVSTEQKFHRAVLDDDVVSYALRLVSQVGMEEGFMPPLTTPTRSAQA